MGRDDVEDVRVFTREELVRDGAREVRNFSGYLIREIGSEKRVYEPYGEGSYVLRNTFDRRKVSA